MRGRFAIISLAYVVALALAVAVGAAYAGGHPIFIAGAGDLAATLAIFAFSFAFRNSSFYDAYWSVAPICIGLYWAFFADSAGGEPLRIALALGLVALWGVRLTYNWARGFPTLDHEDWRYVNLQEQMGVLYWPVSLLGLHAMPTVLVFLACLPLYWVGSAGSQPLGILDGLAFLVMAGAIALEGLADQQLVRFKAQHAGSMEVLRTGLWAWSRHPNYLGEVLFWWGLSLFGLAAGPASLWMVAGALSITGLFLVASLPMIEKRMLERRPDFETVQRDIPMLFPRRPRA